MRPFCKKASIQYGTVAWDEKIDFDPHRLYAESKELMLLMQAEN